MTNTPTKSDITNIANELVSSLGSGVHLRCSDLVYIVENKFPDLSFEQYENMYEICDDVVFKIRSDADLLLWS